MNILFEKGFLISGSNKKITSNQFPVSSLVPSEVSGLDVYKEGHGNKRLESITLRLCNELFFSAHTHVRECIALESFVYLHPCSATKLLVFFFKQFIYLSSSWQHHVNQFLAVCTFARLKCKEKQLTYWLTVAMCRQWHHLVIKFFHVFSTTQWLQIVLEYIHLYMFSS